jgi:hypothetical protein
MQLAFLKPSKFLNVKITAVCTLHVPRNIGHLQVSLKLLMKLLCFRPYVQILGYVLVCAPMCPVVMGSSSYCVMCGCYEQDVTT